MDFQLVPKLVTLNDLEGLNGVMTADPHYLCVSRGLLVILLSDWIFFARYVTLRRLLVSFWTHLKSPHIILYKHSQTTNNITSFAQHKHAGSA